MEYNWSQRILPNYAQMGAVLILCLIGFSNLRAQQQTVGLFHKDSESYDGYTLFTSVWNKGIYLIDNCGQEVNRWDTDFRSANSCYLLPDGNLLRTAVQDGGSGTGFNVGGTGERLQILDWEGNLLWETLYATNEHILHHDIVPMPNGNILALAFEHIRDSTAIATGRDPATLLQGRLFPDKIVEFKPVGTDSVEIVWEWRVWDHLIQDFDPAKPNFGEVGAHPELFDLNFQQSKFIDGSSDWTHYNGIDYHPELDQIVFSSQLWCEFYIIDHSTSIQEAAGHTGGRYGKGGDILYRWGNPETYRKGTIEDRKLWGPHGVYWIEEGQWDAGKLMIFNNGNWRDGNYSEVFVVDPPQETPGNYLAPEQLFGPEEPDWSYGGAENPEFFSWFISNAQRLPNGNTLICEGASGELFEVTSEGREVWRYVNPQHHYGITTQYDTLPFQGVSPGNATFRAQRYAPDFIGFAGKDLTPGDPIELQPLPYDCETSFSLEEPFYLYPHPTQGQIHLFSPQPLVNQPISLELYNLLGQRVWSGEFAGNDQLLNLGTLQAGHYRLRIGDETLLKLVIQH